MKWIYIYIYIYIYMCVCDLSVACNAFDISNVTDIFKYLMKNIKQNNACIN